MTSMNTFPLVPVLGGLLALGGAGLAHAQDEQGRVISSTPVIQQVVVPRQVCQDQTITVPGQKSGAGALMGGIAGGALGNAVGNGSGRALATMIGIVGGAVVGNNIEGGSPPSTQVVQQCSTQNFYENRTVAYNVVYEYAGRQYSTQMPQDPGRFVRLSVTPVGALPPPPPVETYPVPRPQVHYVPAAPITRVVVSNAVVPAYVHPPHIVYLDAHGHRHPRPARHHRHDERWDRHVR
jgi:uncharacterized protein YcfJ